MPIDWPITYEEPDWTPLEAALPPEERVDFMYMGHAGPIVLYKHRWTRRYLNVGANGKTFFRYTGTGYEEIDRSLALEQVNG